MRLGSRRKRPHRLLGVLACALSVLLALSGLAAHASASKVKVGLFVTQLSDFDLPRRSFTISFWMWFLHTDAAYKPIQSVELINSKTITVRFPSTTVVKGVPFDQVKSDVYWDQVKYTATISQDWDISVYPFDRQVLQMHFEDTQSESYIRRLEPDDVSPSVLDDAIDIPGWSIESMRVTTRGHFYNTAFGDPSMDGNSRYSRLGVDIVVKRHGMRLLTSMFIGFFVAFVLSSASYLLEPAGAIASARVGMSGGAIFASVGNKYVVDNNLPPAPVFTLADAIEGSTFAVILFAILVSVVVMELRPKHPVLAARINRICGLGSMVAYVLFNAVLITRAAT